MSICNIEKERESVYIRSVLEGSDGRENINSDAEYSRKRGQYAKALADHQERVWSRSQSGSRIRRQSRNSTVFSSSSTFHVSRHIIIFPHFLNTTEKILSAPRKSLSFCSLAKPQILQRTSSSLFHGIRRAPNPAFDRFEHLQIAGFFTCYSRKPQPGTETWQMWIVKLTRACACKSLSCLRFGYS